MRQILVVPALLLVMALHAPAQTPPPKVGKDDKPSPPPHGGPSRGDRGADWRGGGSGMPGFGRPPMRNDGFEKLPETEKKRVREAFEKVWSRPEVIEARDKSMRANEEMRDVIREALTKIDPEAAAILARVEPKDHFDPRQLPKLPPPESAEFPKAILARMGMEMMAFSRPERHEEARKFHERVIALPQVRAALVRLESTAGEERIQAMQKLREVYREAVGQEFKAARERRAAEEGKAAAPPPPGVKE